MKKELNIVKLEKWNDQRRGRFNKMTRCYSRMLLSTGLLILFASTAGAQSQDCDKNWVLTRQYDENGNEISSQKSFFDSNGKTTQNQARNESSGQVLANQTLYDLQGRPVLQTLTAPIGNSSFGYNNNFITTGGQVYNYLNFDGDPSNTFNPYGKLNAPDPIDNTKQGSLGWYYSNNNTLEPMVAATSYPYAREDYFHDGTGNVKRSSGIGEQLKMGMGHEASSNSFPVQNELNNYLAIRNQFFASAVGGSPTSLSGQALQTISTDENGLKVLSVTDLAGKSTLISGRSDVSGWLSVQNTLTLSNVMPSYVYSFYELAVLGFPVSYESISCDNTTNITIFCTSCSPQTQIYSGPGKGYVLNASPNTSYSIVSTTPFFITEIATNPSHTIYKDQVPAPYAEPATASSQYFQLGVPSVVTVTGNFKLYNMLTEAQITGFSSGNTLQPGYYKVTATAPTTLNTTNTVTVTYTNKYSDLSYNYYNQKGQLIASIAPDGVQKLIQSGYSAYTTASQLPFITLYQYDLQGHLTGVTTPDEGQTQYVYRQDGKIRFSQNAYQKVAANAGAGKVERFSYTNYDIFGRPSEIGEYAVTAATFSTLATNNPLLEATDSAGDVLGASKLLHSNTSYDVPATNLSLSGYVQDAGFLKGEVSYTTDGNNTTWYNYDDHQRVSWVVKQQIGLSGYKTMNYTYNDQGNLSVVEYQRGVPADRFLHFYKYDADGRLINVQTSTDGTTMVQHAHYYYYLHGPLKRVELGDQLQGLDYVYTPQGWLKAINSPTGDATKDPMKDGVSGSFAKDAFGLQLEYFNGDYSRSGSNITSIPSGTATYYNGNITGMSWQSNKPASVVSALGTSIQDPTMYSYTYDPKYQYTQSVWGTPNYATGTFAAGTTFGEKGITYDANGNIMALQRTNSTGVASDNFTKYSYLANTNKLTSVGTTATPTAFASYTYDEIGRLKSEIQTGTSAPKYYLRYNAAGKVTDVYSDAAMTISLESYTYDEMGNHIKTVNSIGSTYYVYDVSGNVAAVYTSTTALPTPVLNELPVYGGGRLGTYFNTGANYVYEIKDNVGSVKLVINRTKVSGQTDVYTYNDFYPYGGVARSGGTTYRYDYQGAYAEKDPVTGLNNFNLRLYDSRIGRWLSTDPEGQYYSSYEGMGNNPVSGTDPTGGEDFDFYQNLQTGQIEWFDGSDEIDGYEHLGGADYTFPGYMLNEVKITEKSLGIGQPSLAASVIPVYGAARSSIDYFQRGKWAMGTFQAAMAISDLFLVKSLATAGVKLGAGLIGKLAAEETVEVAAKTGMTDLELVTKASQKAENAVGGTGRFAGTAKHTYANNLLDRYQSIYGSRGLEFNQYFNGPAGKGFLDIVNHQTMTIYDFKFGKAVMGSRQFLKYSNSFPGYLIEVVKP